MANADRRERGPRDVDTAILTFGIKIKNKIIIELLLSLTRSDFCVRPTKPAVIINLQRYRFNKNKKITER